MSFRCFKCKHFIFPARLVSLHSANLSRLETHWKMLAVWRGFWYFLHSEESAVRANVFVPLLSMARVLFCQPTRSGRARRGIGMWFNTVTRLCCETRNLSLPGCIFLVTISLTGHSSCHLGLGWHVTSFKDDWRRLTETCLRGGKKVSEWRSCYGKTIITNNKPPICS